MTVERPSPQPEAPADMPTPQPRSLMRSGVTSLLASGGTLAVNVSTGIILARALNADGRGEVAALVVLTQFVGWVGSLGGRQAISYRVAREPGAASGLLGGWLALTALLGLLAVVLSEVILPLQLAAQSSQLVDIGRVFVICTAAITAAEIANGFILGSERYGLFNGLKLLQPAILCVGYIVLLVVGALTVTGALVVNVVSVVTMPLVGFGWAICRYGVSRPSRLLMRETLRFGASAHVGAISSLTNMRLDLLVMPSLLSAASVGLYAVATNTVSVIFVLAGTLNFLVLPAAVRRGEKGPETVVLAAAASFLLAGGLGVALAIVGPFLLPFAYGRDFEAAVTPMLLLLPGALFLAPAGVLTAGLGALDRPLRSSIPSLVGCVVTVVGLALFLADGGPTAAAAVSSCAYAAMFLVGIVLYRRTADLSWLQIREILGTLPARLGVRRRLARALRRRRPAS